MTGSAKLKRLCQCGHTKAEHRYDGWGTCRAADCTCRNFAGDPLADAYAAELGEEARARQQRLALDYLACCGELKDDGHHEACSKRPADEPAAVHPDQGALL